MRFSWKLHDEHCVEAALAPLQQPGNSVIHHEQHAKSESSCQWWWSTALYFPLSFEVKSRKSWIATKNEFKLQEVVHRKKSWEEKKKIISENSDISFGHFLLVTHQNCCFLPTTRSSFLDHFNDRVLKKQDADAI